MKNRLLIFSGIFLLAIFQSFAVPNFLAFRPVPDIIVILIIFYAQRVKFEKILPYVALTGFFMDIFSFATLGMHILIYVTLAFGISFISKKFLFIHSSWKFFILVFLVAVGTAGSLALDWSLTVSIAKLAGNQVELRLLSWKNFQKSLLYNILIFIVFYWPLLRIEKLVLDFQSRAEFKKNVR